MSDSKVLLSGSFTEDEIKLLLRQSFEDIEKLFLKKELEDGFADVGINLTFSRVSCSEFNEQFDFSKGTFLSRDCNVKKDRTRVVTKNKGLTWSFKENEDVHYSSHCSLSNASKEFKRGDGIDFTSLHIFENGGGFPNKSLVWHNFIEVHSSRADLNGTKDSSMLQLEEDSQRASVVPAALARDILPRSLINLGNLCFLNATLEALLSCSPFVQLLQMTEEASYLKSLGLYALNTNLCEMFGLPNNTWVNLSLCHHSPFKMM